MEDFSTCLGISWTFSLLCCMIWVFSPAEGKPMLYAVGSRVILHCGNNTINMLNQLTWKMNDDLLFSFVPPTHRHVSNKTLNLNINVSESESQLYALIIERAQTAHTGNYTCETTYTDAGAGKLEWELIITGDNWQTHTSPQKWEKIVIAVAVPCACLLILIISLTIQRTVCTKCRENRSHSSSVERQEQTEDIYENCLGANLSQQRGYTRPHHFKARAH